MSAIFPSADWLKALEDKLNSDEQYARIAKNWEGDYYFIIEPEGILKEQIVFYLDLWHGKCRSTEVVTELSKYKPAFTVKAPYGNFARVMKGELDPIQAMMTRKLVVQGNLGVMLRNIPVVMDFLRCAQESTTGIL